MTRLLIITQAVDKNNPVLGFFHKWIEEFSKQYEKVTVICLEKGEYDLPSNVKVFSLGKEVNNSQFLIFNFHKVKYILNFYRYIFKLRRDYDKVFVHMNQEYVLLGGLFWKIMGKGVYLWRNHARGSILTKLAVLLSNKVFCTSSQSYTVRFNKTKIMPAGINIDFFTLNPHVKRIPNSILFLGRIAPVKCVFEFVTWFDSLGEQFVATVAGEALPGDIPYEKLVKSKASDRIRFIGKVNQNEAKNLYQAHETYVNFTPSGSMDKTILEAAACGTKIKVENKDLKHLENMSTDELRDYVINHHSLDVLMSKLSIEMYAQ